MIIYGHRTGCRLDVTFAAAVAAVCNTVHQVTTSVFGNVDPSIHALKPIQRHLGIPCALAGIPSISFLTVRSALVSPANMPWVTPPLRSAVRRLYDHRLRYFPLFAGPFLEAALICTGGGWPRFHRDGAAGRLHTRAGAVAAGLKRSSRQVVLRCLVPLLAGALPASQALAMRCAAHPAGKEL